MVIDDNLVTPYPASKGNKVERLRSSLHAKAKAEPSYRFYSLWDKVYREDVLMAAYQKCRRNGGSHGVDMETFKTIEAIGKETWLAELQKELKEGYYQPQPLRRVWIAKTNSKTKSRPLSIGCIKDRVVQTAVLLVIEPIFEADMLPEQFGFRPVVDAKMAVRRVYYHVTQFKRTEVIDADLENYFTSIPHRELMGCLNRRIADGKLLRLIKRWLEAPIMEPTRKGHRQSLEAKNQHRGVAQGSPLSPLLSNCYFRLFLLEWKQLGIEQRLNARVVNYADDFVICCKPHTAEKARSYMQAILGRMGLRINEAKTRLVKLPQERIDFLGYTIGQWYNKANEAYWGTRPSKRAVKKVIRKIHEQTRIQTTWTAVEQRVAEVNAITRGWCGYFNQGPVIESYKIIRHYTEKRFRRWLVKKHKLKGTGYRQFPNKYLYNELGLYKLAETMASVPKAKACLC